MYLHIGASVVIPERDVLGIFDLDNTTSSRITRNFLAQAQQAGQVIPVGRIFPNPSSSAGIRGEGQSLPLPAVHGNPAQADGIGKFDDIESNLAGCLPFLPGFALRCVWRYLWISWNRKTPPPWNMNTGPQRSKCWRGWRQSETALACTSAPPPPADCTTWSMRSWTTPSTRPWPATAPRFRWALSLANIITVSDNGRGIPVDIQQQNGETCSGGGLHHPPRRR